MKLISQKRWLLIGGIASALFVVLFISLFLWGVATVSDSDTDIRHTNEILRLINDSESQNSIALDLGRRRLLGDAVSTDILQAQRQVVFDSLNRIPDSNSLILTVKRRFDAQDVQYASLRRDVNGAIIFDSQTMAESVRATQEVEAGYKSLRSDESTKRLSRDSERLRLQWLLIYGIAISFVLMKINTFWLHRQLFCELRLREEALNELSLLPREDAVVIPQTQFNELLHKLEGVTQNG